MKVSDPISDLTFSSPIRTLLGLDETSTNTSAGYKIQIDTPINKDDVKFIVLDPKLVIITCDEVDQHNVDGDVLAILRADKIKDYQFYSTPSRSFKNNYDKKLHIKIKDELGNEIPIKESLIRLTINERLRRKNIPADTYNSTA